MKELNISKKEQVIIDKIVHSIESFAQEKGRNKVLIWFTGFIDSTIITKLTIEALGMNAVKLIVRCDKFSTFQDEVFNNSIEFLKIPEAQIEKCDIEPIIKKIGSENLIPGSMREVPQLYGPISHSLLKFIPIFTEMEGKTYGMVGKASSGREELLHKVIARNKLRSRIHMAYANLIAETENRFVISGLNKTELTTGLFTKWGRGYSADLMPLGDLYRTQILQLGAHLEIPESISNLTKADLLPGIDNKYRYFFDLSVLDVDHILVLLKSGISIKEINKQTDISHEKIEHVNIFFESAIKTRAAPVIPRMK
ncbi:MAG: hypothetical protein ACXAC8_12860 [Candidatus Hodarchaeales archaeon]|jgi:NAD+ synthase